MSDRSKKATMWAARRFCMVFGLMLVSVSLYGMVHGILWVPRFNYTYGEQGVASLGVEFLFGVLLFCVGVFGRDSVEPKSGRKREKRRCV